MYEEVRKVVIELYLETKKQILLKKNGEAPEADKGDEEAKADGTEIDVLKTFEDDKELIDDNADEFVLKLTAIHDDWGKKRSSKRAKQKKESQEKANAENLGREQREQQEEE